MHACSEKAMAPHSSTLAWKIPWTEEPGRLQSTGSLRVRHDWVTSLSLFTFHFPALEKEMATHSSVLAWRIPGRGGASWAAIYGVAQSWTRLTRLSSSSSRVHHAKCRAGWSTRWIQDCWEKYQQSKIFRWYHSKGRKWRATEEAPDESEEESKKAGLKLNIQKTKIMASGPITSWQT